MGGNFHVICGYVSVIDIYLFPIYISIGVHKAMRSMMRRAQRCIEIAELISPEIFSHMGITNINCMYGNAPRAINQNDHKATGLREYCCHLFLYVAEISKTRRPKCPQDLSKCQLFTSVFNCSLYRLLLQNANYYLF